MIFSAARKRAPSIVFLDEVDAIGGSRASMQAGWEKKLISQLLIELDALTSTGQQVMVLGASNAPWDVDFALRRPGPPGTAGLRTAARADRSARRSSASTCRASRSSMRPSITMRAGALDRALQRGLDPPDRGERRLDSLAHGDPDRRDAIAVNMEHLRLAITQTPAGPGGVGEAGRALPGLRATQHEAPGIGFKEEPAGIGAIAVPRAQVVVKFLERQLACLRHPRSAVVIIAVRVCGGRRFGSLHWER